MNDSRSAYHRISDLSKRIDQEATYELVDLFQSPDPGIRLEAARALCGRHIPPVVRERVIEPLFSDRFNDGAATDNLMYIALRCASQTVLQQPAATAFDVVECLLQTNKLNEPLPRARVEAILNAVEERLCFRFTLPASSRELPDRRFCTDRFSDTVLLFRIEQRYRQQFRLSQKSG